MAVISMSSIKSLSPHLGMTKIVLETPPTADSTDTYVVTMSEYGCTRFLGATGWVHTTEGSVVAIEAPTTSVSSTALTIQIGGANISNKKRVYEILME